MDEQTLADLDYRVGYVGEYWAVIRPNGSWSPAIDSDVNTTDTIESAFGGFEPDWFEEGRGPE